MVEGSASALGFRVEGLWDVGLFFISTLNNAARFVQELVPWAK